MTGSFEVLLSKDNISCICVFLYLHLCICIFETWEHLFGCISYVGVSGQKLIRTLLKGGGSICIFCDSLFGVLLSTFGYF